MNPDEEIFEAAAELPDTERAAYLDKACAGQPELRARLDALLRADEATGFMEDRTAVLAGEPLAEQSGERIGRYRLLQQIGEGGFGVVWMAEQVEPVTRRVALKIIKAGMDTREVIARFEAERQALAMMDHPNIAKVLDAGATEKGRPFFVMELVKGIPITKFCDEREFTTRQRLELFADVCSAINHAHQKGVIHRDIKPSNVMVTLHCNKPVIKVIDFGIAKAIEGRLTDKTLFTRFEQFVGTPAYMSPEQSALGGLDVDTRSDIYALGVLLYELLTGQPPFDAKSLLSAGYEEMRRIIREVEPPKPSTRLAQLLTASAAAGPAAKSQISNPKSQIPSDLDWIVMKAIEKDRTRRYETANGLALDIQRYLANEPVSAAAPGVVYLFRKFARRHRMALGLAALIVLVLFAASGFSLWQANLAFTARKETTDALREVEKQKAELDRKSAEQRTLLAEAAQSDRAVAGEMLRNGREREAFAHLARACDYDPLSASAAQEAAMSLDTWQSPLPTTIFAGHEDRVRSVQFSPDGALIVTAANDKTARVWDTATGKSLATLAGHAEGVRSAQFSPNGLRVVTASSDKTARVWDAATGQSLVMLTGHGAGLYSAQFSPDGALIVTAWWDTTARVWDAATGECLATLAGHKQTVRSVHFNRDGSRIVTASWDKTARVWDAATWKGLVTLTGHEDGVSSAQFSPDGALIVTAAGDKTARVWEAVTGRSLVTLAGHEDGVNSAQFSPDGALIVTAADDKTSRVWDAVTGRSLVTLTGHEDGVNSAQFSPDGALIVTAADDKTSRMWDTATGKSLATLAGHGAGVNSAQFSPDGARIVTAGDKTARVWDAIAALAGHAERMRSGRFTNGLRIVMVYDLKGLPPAWFADFLRYMAQMRLNSDGELEPLTPADWLALRERMREVRRAGAGQDTPYLSILRRYVPE
jgi:WD40 repeat protein